MVEPMESAFGVVLHLLTARTFPEPARPLSQSPFQLSSYPKTRNALAILLALRVASDAVKSRAVVSWEFPTDAIVIQAVRWPAIAT